MSDFFFFCCLQRLMVFLILYFFSPKVLDACSAPGNKTVHLAALMRGEGKIIACELNKERVKRLECTIKQAGATSILSDYIYPVNCTTTVQCSHFT